MLRNLILFLIVAVNTNIMAQNTIVTLLQKDLDNDNNLTKSRLVYKTEFKSEADQIVYITPYRVEANLIVYETKLRAEVAQQKGIWFWTTFKQEADWKIYFTKQKTEATLLLYYTKYRQEAHSQ